ncbi:hypothetical protein A2Z22_01935 [Candidatus Woesebacteria bacterium RBG_16_34_12]|uniref:HEPN AbiJ-N-terminal domain-containing protein n=1 Tax=Candidatus Woesebacteria bacterium RBG_16_34_12 TaxID=1802480 RepID=A0A1F7XAJ6_9BACT|nr:MAG: hypothetical protein A2Z22_01935 [Candidatus Woesebacteria bacterium RBG_16_34_12]
MSFSQRKGITPVKNIIQIDSMDDDLRNRLWDALSIFYWSKVNNKSTCEFLFDSTFAQKKSYNPTDYPVYKMGVLLQKLWHGYFKLPIDTIEDYSPKTNKKIRDYFFNCKWNEVYDFIEFVANNYPDENNSVNLKFMDFSNSILKEELSTYQFVGGKIAQITSEEEIAEIEEALKIPISPVQQHIKRGLELLSDKKEPDYRNSIKESISAVESICKLIANNNKATLTKAIETIENGKKVKMHPALGHAFINLYSYTNDADGIRHSLKDEPNLDLEDAKFMLVSCSAFINYLIVKSSKAGIKL